MIRNNICLVFRNDSIGDSVFSGYSEMMRFVRRIQISRGKSSVFSAYNAGSMTVEFTNNLREAGPERNYWPPAGSQYPFFYEDTPQDFTKFRHAVYLTTLNLDASIQPADADKEDPNQRGRLSVTGVGPYGFGSSTGFTEVIFGGISEDWEFNFELEGDNTATMTAYDPLSYLRYVDSPFPYQQTINLPSQRAMYFPMESIGEFNNFNKPNYYGQESQSTILAFGPDKFANRSDMLNAIAEAEQGDLFASRFGQMRFLTRYERSEYVYVSGLNNFEYPAAQVHEFGEDGIPFFELAVDYSSELIYNKITLQNTNSTVATASDGFSELKYGKKELQLTDLLASDSDLSEISTFLLNKYYEKKFRVTSISVNLTKYDQESGLSPIQRQLLTADLGDHCVVNFNTPTISQSGPENLVAFVGQIIGIDHDITPESHIVRFTLDDKRHSQFILDDKIFGRLDENVLN